MSPSLKNIEIPWVEKYRPTNFDEIVSQNVAINNLKKFVKTNNMPHMIFTGPAGTGKTSTALIIAKSKIKKEDYFQNVLELNASDTVRMDYVRNVIKEFVNQSMIVSKETLKFIILDEADNIPTQVQQSLRRIIEKASDNVKFILMCNYINRIIDPIVSRCAVFRFVSLSKEKIVERLKFITKQEKITIPQNDMDDFYSTLFFISGGDLRKAINTLQMSVSLELIENLEINEILKISGFLDKQTLDKLVDAIKTADFKKTTAIISTVENLDSRNFVRQIMDVIADLDIDSPKLIPLTAFIGDIDYKISQGADQYIQITAMLAEIINSMSNT